MKAKIHPKWYPEAKVSCVCGAAFTTGSTLPEIKVDICSACHPFFTGEARFVDVQGRVEKFQAKQKKAQEKKFVKKSLRKKLQIEDEERKEKSRPKSLKEMLGKKK